MARVKMIRRVCGHVEATDFADPDHPPSLPSKKTPTDLALDHFSRERLANR